MMKNEWSFYHLSGSVLDIIDTLMLSTDFTHCLRYIIKNDELYYSDVFKYIPTDELSS